MTHQASCFESSLFFHLKWLCNFSHDYFQLMTGREGRWREQREKGLHLPGTPTHTHTYIHTHTQEWGGRRARQSKGHRRNGGRAWGCFTRGKDVCFYSSTFRDLPCGLTCTGQAPPSASVCATGVSRVGLPPYCNFMFIHLNFKFWIFSLQDQCLWGNFHLTLLSDWQLLRAHFTLLQQV